MQTVWYVLLGLMFAGYFVLGGYDYGVGLLLPGARSAEGRRAALNAVGPFFLGNEVWLVAAAGVLFGAFPVLEGELLAGLYPLFVTVLIGVITVMAAVGLRSRARGEPARAGWDRLITAASVLAAAGWGAVLGGWLQGTGGPTVTPFVGVCAVALLAVVAVHGSAFLALRLPAGAAERFAGIGARLTLPALAAVGAAAVAGLLSGRVRDAIQQPAVPVLVLVAMAAALLAARGALGRRRPGLAFAATGLALALPLLLVLGSTYPYALGPDLTVAEAAAAPDTLRILNWLALPLVPVLIGFQLMCWWAFRGRLNANSPVFY
jgi:cytochrome d ubiquinol oxidase subunit II